MATEQAIEEQIAAGERIVDLLAREGCDLASERLVSHGFIGDGERLADLARTLFLLGYRMLRTADDSCLAEALACVDHAWVREVTTEMAALAEDLGVVYDGWEAGTDAPVDDPS